MVVNELDMESYLVGIVNSEISSKYPKEAIKAQVVAARSYALACLKERRPRQMEYDLDSTDMDQVYKGAHVEDAKSHFAVQETRGKVLLNSGKVVKAYYHASSGVLSSVQKQCGVQRILWKVLFILYGRLLRRVMIVFDGRFRLVRGLVLKFPA